MGWGILLNEKYNNNPTQQPINLKASRIADMQNGRIKIRTTNGVNQWQCGYCDKKFNFENENGVSQHIGRVHKEIKITNLLCPYCPATFKNIANLKHHILKKKLCKQHT